MGEIYDCDGLLVLNGELNSLVCQNYNTGDKHKGRTMGLSEPRERVEISSSFDQHPGDCDQISLQLFEATRRKLFIMLMKVAAGRE